MGTRMRQIGYWNALKKTSTFSRNTDLIRRSLDIQGDESWAIRIEIRLPFHQFLDSFEDIRGRICERVEEGRWIYILPSRLYADFLLQRLNTLCRSLEVWRCMNKKNRMRPKSISLAIILIYMINGLLNNPPIGRIYRKIGEYNIANEIGNAFFIAGAVDWRTMAIEEDELEYEDIVYIVGGIDKYRKL